MNDEKREPPFVENGYMEKLLNLAERDPKTFNTLSPATRLSVGYYSAAKRQAEALKALHGARAPKAA